MPTKLFGTSGVRGPADTLFSDEFCMRIGYVFGNWLLEKRKSGFVALAMDPRESSPRIKSRISFGLALAGWEILDQGIIPTPALTYLTQQEKHVAGAMMITGSHITANLNGVKMLIDGAEISKAQEIEIEELFSKLSREPMHKVVPIIEYQTVGKDIYLELLKKMANVTYPKWKVVVDTTNGAQTEIWRQFLDDLKIKYIPVGDFNVQSPNFVPCDTEVPAMFTNLTKAVIDNKADFGIAFDVDGDRAIFIDEKGRFIPGDYSCSLIAKNIKTSVVVTPVSTSSVIDHIGKTIVRTKVGSTQVAAAMQSHNSHFGFEANGGGISPEVCYGRDGGVTAVKFLNLLADSKLKLSELVSQLPEFHQVRTKIDCPFDKYSKIYQAAKTRYSSLKIDEMDGVKVYVSEDDWILFRGSGNAPEFRVFTESRNAKKAESMSIQAMDLVRSIIAPHQTTSFSSGSDKQHMLDSILAFPEQCKQVISEVSQQHVPSECSLVENIVISGMGGSALGGRILASLERQTLRVPIIISTEYHLPNFVNKRTLVVLSSYSGNTDETLSSLDEALARGAQVFILASGGKLAEIAKSRNLPHYIFSPIHNKSGQPRIGLGYNIMALVMLLSRCQLITPISNASTLPAFLKQSQSQDLITAKSIANKLQMKLPFIFAAEHLKGAAHDFQNQLNENAKTFATHFDLPEANHHLLEGLTFPKTNSENLIAVFLESKKYHREIIKRVNLTQKVLEKNGIPFVSISASGDSALFETMHTVQLASLVAFELSQLNGIDPSPIPWVDYFKDELKR